MQETGGSLGYSTIFFVSLSTKINMSCCGCRRNNKWEHQVPVILQETGWEIFVRANERTEGKIVRIWRAAWMAIAILKLVDLRTDSHAIFLEGSTGHTVVQSRALALVRVLKLHATLLHYSVRNLMSIWALILLLKEINYISGQSKRWRRDEHTDVSRPGAPLRPGCARRSRDHFATDSVRSKLPPVHVPVSPAPCLLYTSPSPRD